MRTKNYVEQNMTRIETNEIIVIVNYTDHRLVFQEILLEIVPMIARMSHHLSHQRAPVYFLSALDRNHLNKLLIASSVTN